MRQSRKNQSMIKAVSSTARPMPATSWVLKVALLRSIRKAMPVWWNCTRCAIRMRHDEGIQLSVLAFMHEAALVHTTTRQTRGAGIAAHERTEEVLAEHLRPSGHADAFRTVLGKLEERTVASIEGLVHRPHQEHRGGDTFNMVIGGHVLLNAFDLPQHVQVPYRAVTVHHTDLHLEGSNASEGLFEPYEALLQRILVRQVLQQVVVHPHA